MGIFAPAVTRSRVIFDGEVGCIPDALMLTRCMVADHARSFALRHVQNNPSRSRFSPTFVKPQACTSEAYHSVGICPVGEFPMSSEQGSLLPRSMGITSARVGRRGVISTLL
jgi:hypothetical protein